MDLKEKRTAEIQRAICEALVECGFEVERKEGLVYGEKGDHRVKYSPNWILRTMREKANFNNVYSSVLIENSEAYKENKESYMPHWLTENERIMLSENVFDEIIDGKLIVFMKSSNHENSRYVTEEEMKNNPKIREEAISNLNMIESYDYKIKEYKEDKFIRIQDVNAIPEPRSALLTKVVQGILTTEFGEDVYVVTTGRGLLLAFSIDEDPIDVLKNILLSEIGLLDREFEVLSLNKGMLENIFKVTTYTT
ncbi:MAG: hypothetical protein K8R73_06330 [Clostridiales bacterium]|nr:hypothetical protein [Clostridiales bacterium]